MIHFNKTEVNKVIAFTAKQWKISAADLIGPLRTGKIAQARQASMAVCYWNGLGKSKDIATAHNRANHATVLHACNTVNADTLYNTDYKAKVMSIINQF